MTIEINIKNKNELYEKYNQKMIASDFVDFVVSQVKEYSSDITLNFSVSLTQEDENAIKEAFQKDYERCNNAYKHNNVKQAIFIMLGLILLLWSLLLQHYYIVSEIFIIAGWVLIWETLDIEIFRDPQNRKRRKILKNLLNCKITSKKM